MKKALEKYIIPILAVLGIVLLAQWTKRLTLLYAKGTDGFYIINKVLRIYFVRNENSAISVKSASVSSSCVIPATDSL